MAVKKLPESELKAPGVLIKTKSGKQFNITSNADRTKFTLWEITSVGYEKISSNADYGVLRDKVPMGG